MVKVVVLSANGEKRTLNTTAFTPTTVTGATVAKALRKTKPASVILTYVYAEQKLSVWGWTEGKAGTENSHELPPDAAGIDAPVLYGDTVVVSSMGDFTEDQYAGFYDEACGGFDAASSDSESEAAKVEVEEEDEEIDDEEEEEEAEDEEKEEEEEEEGEAEEEAEEEEAEEEEDADDDCYDDGDDNGGGGKRRAPRRRTTAAPEYRRLDMGLRSRIKVPAPLGKRAPKWQTAPELEEEAY